MPLYDFRCEACNATVELVRSMREAMDQAPCAKCGVPMVQQLGAAHLSPDISPYKAVAGDRAGKYITSRRDHREYLKRNRLVEIGTDAPKDTKKLRSTVRKGEIREELRRVVPQVMRQAKRR